ncbi:MAG: ATP-binding cassette domain-containing protein [Candidatus Competibacteraceae bacterium]|nr:MAG: ATP-binding cassette domain-containing protein [Candidatus Competibacteraceae bacterium]
MINKTLVQVERLTRRYGEHRAVDDLSFTLRRGQVLGLLGPNGAGKSTTLRMLAGVLAPDAGRIVINGRDLLDQPRQARQAIGYLPEQPPLYRELTVDEQLYYSARLHGLSRTASHPAIARVKERCGLAEVGKRLIGHLSKGYQQRTGLAQAIVHTPPVIILDEPTIGLDPIQIQGIRTLIRELGRKQGVILSTHLLSEVQSTCTHVHILRAGRLVYAGALAELEQQRPSASLRIGLNAPPPIAELEQLPRVTQVEELGEGQFRLHHSPGALLHRILVELAYDHGWDLWELTPERESLEQMFVNLTLNQETAG